MIDLDIEKSDSETVICLGNFDGLHLGHQQLVKKTVEIGKEEGFIPSILFFKDHTQETLKKEKRDYLTTLEDKIELVRQLGIEKVFLLSFNDKTRRMEKEEFISFLTKKAKAKRIVVGKDFRFGFKASGDIEDLKDLEEKYYYKTYIVPDFKLEGTPVSTTQLRKYLEKGDLDHAHKILGRNYKIRGEVIPGMGRGKTLGFPTANVEASVYFLPKEGVYQTYTVFKGVKYPSITFVGRNISFGEEVLKSETYIYDFDQDIYGKEIDIEFLEFIRENILFENSEELVEQVFSDLEKVKNKF